MFITFNQNLLKKKSKLGSLGYYLKDPRIKKDLNMLYDLIICNNIEDIKLILNEPSLKLNSEDYLKLLIYCVKNQKNDIFLYIYRFSINGKITQNEEFYKSLLYTAIKAYNEELFKMLINQIPTGIISLNYILEYCEYLIKFDIFKDLLKRYSLGNLEYEIIQDTCHYHINLKDSDKLTYIKSEILDNPVTKTRHIYIFLMNDKKISKALKMSKNIKIFS